MRSLRLNQLDDLLDAVKKFGITGFSKPEEIQKEIQKEKTKFENEGLDKKELSDISSTNNGELITILKDGSIRKTIIHIVDISSWPKEWEPKFHIYNCEKIQEMRGGGKKHRYRASSRTSGKFFLIKNAKEWEEFLKICSFCLQLYNKSNKSNNTKENFPLKKYIEDPISSSHFRDVQLDHCSIPNTYTDNWSKISHIKKEIEQYKCSGCGRDFSNPECKKFLHTHHIDADKRNNTYNNLQVLCIECHSKEHNHKHIKNSEAYKEYLNSDCPKDP